MQETQKGLPTPSQQSATMINDELITLTFFNVILVI